MSNKSKFELFCRDKSNLFSEIYTRNFTQAEITNLTRESIVELKSHFDQLPVKDREELSEKYNMVFIAGMLILYQNGQLGDITEFFLKKYYDIDGQMLTLDYCKAYSDNELFHQVILNNIQIARQSIIEEINIIDSSDLKGLIADYCTPLLK